jgi:hypothetical protein
MSEAEFTPGLRATVEFNVDGTRYTLAQMLESNADDEHFCEWARTARPGDFYPGLIRCDCIAAGDFTEQDLIAIDLEFAAGKASGALDRACDHRALERQVQRERCGL